MLTYLRQPIDGHPYIHIFVVLIVDGNSQYVAHAYVGKYVFTEEAKIRSVTSFDQIECLREAAKN